MKITTVVAIYLVATMSAAVALQPCGDAGIGSRLVVGAMWPIILTIRLGVAAVEPRHALEPVGCRPVQKVGTGRRS